MEKSIKPDVRYLNEMKEMFIDASSIKENTPLYYMYRGVKQEDELRYDITVLPPLLIGEEFNKTKGHCHCSGHEELYIVLKGQALFLMQKQEKEEITDVFYIKAEPKEAAIVPQGYSHFTINPSPEETLETANWVSINCLPDYKPIEKMKGASYYYTTKGWIKNNNYKKVPPIREEKPLKQAPQELSFLK
ncbi:MAG TPA: glucose-6-phosphate isomerase family protein [Candidatus Pacearchaeota archaeon]|nr:glucose-6-phosphate isomerase family protein [Candidatus Pacearchaeota archaeon]